MSERAKEFIRKLNGVRKVTVEGHEVCLRPLPASFGLEMALRGKNEKAEFDPKDMQRVIAICVVDEEGTPIFSDPDLVTELPFKAINQIVQDVFQHAGLTQVGEGEGAATLPKS